MSVAAQLEAPRRIAPIPRMPGRDRRGGPHPRSVGKSTTMPHGCQNADPQLAEPSRHSMFSSDFPGISKAIL